MGHKDTAALTFCHIGMRSFMKQFFYSLRFYMEIYGVNIYLQYKVDENTKKGIVMVFISSGRFGKGAKTDFFLS